MNFDECKKIMLAKIKESNADLDIYLKQYEDSIFSPCILKLMLYDVASVFEDQSIHVDFVDNVLALATNQCYLDGFVPPCGDLLKAMPILWISYCTAYHTSEDFVYQLDSNTKGLLREEKNVQNVICSEFFNTMYAPPVGKIKKMYLESKKAFGEKWRVKRDDSELIDKDVDFLLYVLNNTGFNYLGPAESTMIRTSPDIRKEWYEEAKKRLSF